MARKLPSHGLAGGVVIGQIETALALKNAASGVVPAPGPRPRKLAPSDPLDVGDVLLVGINAQALVSRAIKLGSVLRFQPAVARVAGVAQALLLAAAIALSVVFGWSLLGAILAVLVGFVVSVPVVWVIATVGTPRRRDPDGQLAAYWARYSHTAIVTRVEDGTVYVSEALSNGVKQRPLAYDRSDFNAWRVPMSAEDLAQVLAFCDDVVRVRHEGYGYVTFLSLFIYCLTASIPCLPTLVLMESGTSICSGSSATPSRGRG